MRKFIFLLLAIIYVGIAHSEEYFYDMPVRLCGVISIDDKKKTAIPIFTADKKISIYSNSDFDWDVHDVDKFEVRFVGSPIRKDIIKLSNKRVCIFGELSLSSLAHKADKVTEVFIFAKRIKYE